MYIMLCICYVPFYYNSDTSSSVAGQKSIHSSFKSTPNDKSEALKVCNSHRDSLPMSNYENKPGSLLQQEANLPPNVGISRKISKFAKEKKAAKTLGTVMGIFIICWLPFFITNVISGVCGQLNVDCISNPHIVFPTLTWLGWLNSCMNPFIYASCSNDFRR